MLNKRKLYGSVRNQRAEPLDLGRTATGLNSRFPQMLYPHSKERSMEKSSTLQRDPRTEIEIQVNLIRDVNLPKFAVSAHKSAQKQIGCCCFSSNLEHSADLTRTGFSVGSNVPVTVNVVNGSSRRIKMRASIQKSVMYYAGGHTRQDTKIKLVSVLSPDIAPHSQHSWSVDNLIVPTIAPSFEGSAIIKMQYFLKVTVVIPLATNSSVSIPITIGNMPLNGSIIQGTEFA